MSQRKETTSRMAETFGRGDVKGLSSGVFLPLGLRTFLPFGFRPRASRSGLFCPGLAKREPRATAGDTP